MPASIETTKAETASRSSPGAKPRRGPPLAWVGWAFLILLGVATVAYIAGKAATNPILFLQNLLDGLKLGFVYALIALGYTMVYGIVKLINFAHGDVFMVGAFTSFYAVSRFGLHQWPAALFPGMTRSLGSDRLDHGRAPVDGGLRGARRHHRAGRLQAPARRPAHRGPHHGHRRLLLPRILRSPPLRLFGALHSL